jgi:type II secretory pathway pseudopilin PulG
MVRAAFTMIELIFSIVIIGISIMSLPTMTNVINKGIENNLNQEAIFAASSKLMDSTSGYWADRSMEDINKSHISRVIDINGNCNSTTRLRPGHINQPYHRRCLDSTSNLNIDANVSTLFSIDDYAHTNEKVFINYTKSSNEYKQDYTSSLNVELNSSDNNIKNITITIDDESGNTITVLKTYSANIGETEYFKRTF